MGKLAALRPGAEHPQPQDRQITAPGEKLFIPEERAPSAAQTSATGSLFCLHRLGKGGGGQRNKKKKEKEKKNNHVGCFEGELRSWQDPLHLIALLQTGSCGLIQAGSWARL